MLKSQIWNGLIPIFEKKTMGYILILTHNLNSLSLSFQ